MISLNQNNFKAVDGKTIYYHTTLVNSETKGIVLMIHGMAEYGQRYQYFADQMYQHHYASVIIDLRGHGETGERGGSFGHFADYDGWKRIIQDIHLLTFLVKKQYPDLPLFLFGHSMGSVAARCCISQFGHLYHGAVICGTTLGINPVILAAGATLAEYEVRCFGAAHPSFTLTKMSFGGYNKAFVSNRTALDWLSENEENVDRYIRDPHCGFICSAAFYRDLFSGIAYAGHRKAIASIPKDLPVLLIAGDCDPVGGMGKEIRLLYKKMQHAGMKNVTMELVAGKRHEILNEVNRDETIGDIIGFLDGILN